MSIGGDQFIVLRAKLIKAIMNTDANTGGVSKPDLVNAYHGNQGVSDEFVGTNICTTFGWKSVLDLKDDVLFFCPPLDSPRNYNLLSRKGLDSAAYVKKIYWAMETTLSRAASIWHSTKRYWK